VYVAIAMRTVVALHGGLVLCPDSSHGIDDQDILMEHWYVKLVAYVMKYMMSDQSFLYTSNEHILLPFLGPCQSQVNNELLGGPATDKIIDVSHAAPTV